MSCIHWCITLTCTLVFTYSLQMCTFYFSNLLAGTLFYLLGWSAVTDSCPVGSARHKISHAHRTGSCQVQGPALWISAHNLLCQPKENGSKSLKPHQAHILQRRGWRPHLGCVTLWMWSGKHRWLLCIWWWERLHVTRLLPTMLSLTLTKAARNMGIMVNDQLSFGYHIVKTNAGHFCLLLPAITAGDTPSK